MSDLKEALQVLMHPSDRLQRLVEAGVPQDFTRIANRLPKDWALDRVILDWPDSEFETVIRDVRALWKGLIVVQTQVFSSPEPSPAGRDVDLYVKAAGTLLTSFIVLRRFRMTLPRAHLMNEHLQFESKCRSLWNGDFTTLVTTLSSYQAHADLIENTQWFQDFFEKIRAVVCLGTQIHPDMQGESLLDALTSFKDAQLLEGTTHRSLFSQVFDSTYVARIQQVVNAGHALSPTELGKILRLFDNVQKSIESKLVPILSRSLVRLGSIPDKFKQQVWRYPRLDQREPPGPPVCWVFLAATSCAPEDIDNELDIMWLRETLLDCGVRDAAIRVMMDEMAFRGKVAKAFLAAHPISGYIAVDKAEVVKTVRSMIANRDIAAPFRLIVMDNHGHTSGITFQASEASRDGRRPGRINVFNRTDLLELLRTLEQSYRVDEEGHSLVVIVTCESGQLVDSIFNGEWPFDHVSVLTASNSGELAFSTRPVFFRGQKEFLCLGSEFVREMICLFKALPAGFSCSLPQFAEVLSKRIRSSGINVFHSPSASSVDIRRFFGCADRRDLITLPENLWQSSAYCDSFSIEPCLYLCCDEGEPFPVLSESEVSALGEFGNSYRSHSGVVAKVDASSELPQLCPDNLIWEGVYVDLWMALHPEIRHSFDVPSWRGRSYFSCEPETTRFKNLLYAMGFPQTDHRGMNNFSWFLFRRELKDVVAKMQEMGFLFCSMSELEDRGVFDEPTDAE
jgi:hypothetical protein